jgi:23S rRNA pseudouridine955/2504/2580 synthase
MDRDLSSWLGLGDTKMLEFRIEEDFAGVRLDKFLRKRLPDVPTSHLFKMIRTKKVRVNGKRAQPEQPLQPGDQVSVRGTQQRLLPPSPPERLPRPAPPLDLSLLRVLFEDDWLMAIDKPSGMAVHTGSGITSGTVVDYVRAYLGERAVRNDFAASPAHRLDKETSGVLVVAKRRPAMVHFTDVFTYGRAKKRYLTLVKGRMPQPKGLVDLPLAEHQQTSESRARRGVNMQPARTRWTLVRQGSDGALLSCTIETGRTHQIRRHLAAIGHPVAGDRRYGDFAFNREVRARWGLKRLFLHAERIELPHPNGGETLTLEAPLPAELREVLHRAALALP